MSAPETGAETAPKTVLYRATRDGVNTADGAFLHSGADYEITGKPEHDDATLIANGSLVEVPPVTVESLTTELKARGVEPPSGAKKADLQKLLDEAKAAPSGEEA